MTMYLGEENLIQFLTNIGDEGNTDGHNIQRGKNKKHLDADGDTEDDNNNLSHLVQEHMDNYDHDT